MKLTEEEAKAFVENLNRNFSEPFLKKGLFTAWYDEDAKEIGFQIGRRDVEFDLNLEQTGSGTMMGDWEED